jgi:hypothetical protein
LRSSGSTHPRIAAGLPILVGLLIGLSACGSTTPSSPTPSSPTTPSASVVPSAPAGSSSPASTGPPSASPAATAAGPSTTASRSAVEADPGLFACIGDAADGLTFQYDTETTVRVAADPDLALNAVGLAIGLYTVPNQQPIVDFAIVSVVRLRDATVDDAWYRSYRDSYDTAACAQAGGVARHAESTIGPNHVYIGSCAGGAFTYHVRLAAQPIVVSITAAGPARLGERLAGSVGQ